MTMAISKAAEEGAQAVICASTGNTSASAAAYAVRAGMTCAVLVPQGKIALGKMAQALVHGAQLLQVDGNFDDCLELAQKLAVDYPVALVNSVNPYRIAGPEDRGVRDLRRARPRPRRALHPGRQRRQHHRLLDGLPGVRRRRRRRRDAADVRLPGRRRGADRHRARRCCSRPRSPPRSASATRRRGRSAEQARDESGGLIDAVTDRQILAGLPAASPAARRVFVEPASAASVAGLLPPPPTAGCRRARRSSAPSPATASRTRSGRSPARPKPITVPVDAHAAAAAPRPGVSAGGHRVDRRGRASACPATSANLGPGFDALGLALGLHDDVAARVIDDGLDVEVDGRGRATRVARDETHLVVRAMRRALRRAAASRRPGSRWTAPTASRTAAASARRRRPSSPACCWPGRWCADGASRLDDADVLALAAELEGHPDNVAPCLLGGLTVAWIDATARPAPCAATSTRRSCRSCSIPPFTPRPSRPAGCCRHGPARRRRVRRRPGGAARRRAHRHAAGAVRRHRGPAAPGLPGAGHARQRRSWSTRLRAAGPAGGGLRRRTDGARPGSRSGRGRGGSRPRRPRLDGPGAAGRRGGAQRVGAPGDVRARRGREHAGGGRCCCR